MRLFYHAVFAVLFFLAPAQAEEPQFVPQVDVSEIKTYADYEWASSTAYRIYEHRQTEAYAAFDTASSAAFNAYWEKHKALLIKLRTEDRSTYFEWLDAKVMMDYDRVFKLQETATALKEYTSAEQVISAEYDTQKDAAYAEYEAIKDAAYAVYQTEKDMAYEAYQTAASQ